MAPREFARERRGPLALFTNKRESFRRFVVAAILFDA
jgi:hypothetical protein